MKRRFLQQSGAAGTKNEPALCCEPRDVREGLDDVREDLGQLGAEHVEVIGETLVCVLHKVVQVAHLAVRVILSTSV